MEENFDQLKILTRSYLNGAGMVDALRAVNLGLEWHTETRKDGVTPEYVHQLSQIQQVRSLRGVNDLEATICVIALHDLAEDKRYEPRWIYHEFNDRIGLAVERMSKKLYGKRANKSPENYYYEISQDELSSIAKGIDRKHNQATMPGVFDIPKMWEFMQETEDFVLPMLREARKKFPSQELAYTSLRHSLKEQIHLIKSCLTIGYEAGHRKATMMPWQTSSSPA